MRKGLKLSIVVVGILLLGGLGIGFAVPRYAAGSESPPPLPAFTGSSPKNHIVEVLTGVWCPPCGAADPALSRIQDEYADNLLLLAYHCCTLNTGSGNYDPWYETTVLTPRDTFYGFQYLPTTVFDGGGRFTDGTLFKIGSGSTSASYDTYRFPLEDNVDTSSNIALDLVGDLTTTSASARVTITATDPLQPMETSLYLRTVLYIDGLYWTQASGVPYHRNIVVALNEQPFTVAYPGSVTLTASFVLNPAWNTAKLGIASFVQSATRTALNIPSYPGHYGSDILNAAWRTFVP
ncbi:MAG TPA: hypothetical protein VGR51_06075, partial [Thermoplasmata archaeon]|nr:hypothetical protein [Thermoplasmata archaeon]